MRRKKPVQPIEGCLADSGSCINTIHGNQNKYDYAFADASGRDCCCVFQGNSADIEQLKKDYQDVIDKLRA